MYNEERIEFAKRYGFKSMELLVGYDNVFYPGQNNWKEKAHEIKAIYDRADIEIFSIGGFYNNVLDEKTSNDKIKNVENVILLAKEMNVKVVAGFSGRIVDKPLEESIPAFKKIWTYLAKFASDNGVKIAFEHCPMGSYHLPPEGTNMMCTPEMWEKGFNEVSSEAIGLEYDPSHLICQMIDPIAVIKKFGNRIYHVHAKDAKINKDIIRNYGIYYNGSIEHCFPGFGDANWPDIIKELRRIGYSGNLDIEGGHDLVYRDHENGLRLEDEGLIIALKYLNQFIK